MLEDIDIYNVKFGDCFILKNNSYTENSNKMLVDFGSLQRINQPVINGVNNELARAKSKYLMVTHFHSDHYKGIQKLNKNIIFNEIYLPNYFSRAIIKLQFTILSILKEWHPAYQIAYNLLSVIPDLIRHMNKKTKIIFVKRGDYIRNNLDTFRILWPDVKDFDGQAQKLYKEVISYYNLGEGYQDYLERLTERYFSALPETREYEASSIVLQFEDKELKTERIQKIKDDIEYISNEIDKPRKRLKNSLREGISSYQNQVCLCFDNGFEYNVSENKCVLFLSDICREHIQKIIASEDNNKLELLEHYNVIKVPHHGTKDYFVPNLPSSIHMIVPNGYARRISWKITSSYGYHYWNRIFICADYKACQYSLLRLRCLSCCLNPCICGFYPHYLLNL